MPLAHDADRYESYYAGKLWRLLPEIYRALDSSEADRRGPLREIVDRIGAQAAVLRRSIDRTWEDQSIESCDDWVIPYIGDLLATRIVGSLDARGQRLDVAKTIRYRRRKGTVAVLEELTRDITGWDARIVELFRRMGRARHNLDFEIGQPAPPEDDALVRQERAERTYGPVTRTPSFGTADLRSPHGAAIAGSAYDELAYTMDVRAGRGRTGWYNVPRLGVFVSRLRAYPVEGVTPVAHATCPLVFSFDPTGRTIQLYAAATRTYGDEWSAPAEHQVSGPISRSLFFREWEGLWATIDAQNGESILPRSLGVHLEAGGDPSLLPASEVHGDPTMNGTHAYVDPKEGLLYLTSVQSAAGAPVMAYHYGFSSDIGAGTYDRRDLGLPSPTSPEVMGGGAQLDAALTAAAGSGVVSLGDSRTYTAVPDLDVTSLIIHAVNRRRPLLRLPDTPGGTTVWTIHGAGPEAELVLDGIFVSGGEILLTGEFAAVTIRTSTLDPGDEGDPPPGGGSAPVYASAVDGRDLAPCRLRVGALVRRLVIERSITGPIVVESPGAIESVWIADSVVQALHEELAIDAPIPSAVALTRSTILGAVSAHRLAATSSILHGAAQVSDTQHSCLRFCAWTSGSKLPRKFESYDLPSGASVFTSRRFGEPAYAQLSLSVPPRLLDGGEDGAEMGAFSSEKGPIKERSLRIKLSEYMPAGLTPVLIYTT